MSAHMVNPMEIRLKAFAGALALVTASTLIALGIGELVARFFFPPTPVALEDGLWSSGAYRNDPVLGWRPSPNMTYRSRVFDATFTTNSRGLRDSERSLETIPGVERIVVLGDSFTWGWGVNDHEVFPRILESKLQGTEVINLGVTAYGLAQEFAYLKLEGALYRPNTVILAFCQNDIFREGPSSSAQETRPATNPVRSADMTSGMLSSAKRWLSEKMALYSVARQAINSNRTLVNMLVGLGLKEGLHGFEGLDNNLMPALREYPPQLQASLEKTQTELLQMRDWLATRNIRFIVALIPAVQAIDTQAFEHSISYSAFDPSDFELDKPYRDMEKFARAHDIEVINAYPALKQLADGGARLYLRNDLHFNAAGHQAFASEIAAYLQRFAQPRSNAPSVH
jgi:lysophospholipase L1-like esterase